jgi:hypothetical protein
MAFGVERFNGSAGAATVQIEVTARTENILPILSAE